MNKNSLVKSLGAVGISLIVVKIASLFKVSFIFGSSMAFFSGSSIAVPLVGLYGGLLCSLLLLGMGCVGRLLFESYSLHFLAYHIPGLCAALYWSRTQSSGSKKSFLSVILSLVCMVVFAVHPVGGKAFAYSLYWLIPVVLYMVNHNSVFLHALSSTFIAHAVGSVIWLYTVPMTVAQWYALIPVVAVERLLFASGGSS